MAVEPPKDPVLKELLVLYFYVLRMRNTYGKDGWDWDQIGTLPAWKRGPAWHEVGQKHAEVFEKLLKKLLDKQYPTWDAIHGDPTSDE